MGDPSDHAEEATVMDAQADATGVEATDGEQDEVISMLPPDEGSAFA